MTVFVVHPVRDDISQALRFGELRYVTKGYVYGDELDNTYEESPNIGDWCLPADDRQALYAAAAGFNPSVDYLLIAGDHLQLVAFVAMLAARGSFRVLRFDRKISDYIPVLISYHLVPTPRPVLPSTNIGDTDGQELAVETVTIEDLTRGLEDIANVEYLTDPAKRKPPC